MLKNIKIPSNALLIAEVVLFALVALGARDLLNAAAAAWGFAPILTTLLGFVILVLLVLGAYYVDAALTRFLKARGLLK